jgi:hypothetical protein
MGSNGYMVDGIQVHKGMPVSQNKSGNVWIYSTVCTGYTWSPLTSANHGGTGAHHRVYIIHHRSARSMPSIGRSRGHCGHRIVHLMRRVVRGGSGEVSRGGRGW